MTEGIKLGIDAKWYFKGPPSGRVVVKSLVDEFVKPEYRHLQIYLFIDQIFRKEAECHFPKWVRIVPVRANPNLLSNVFILPRIARLLKLNVVIFQNFAGFKSRSFSSIAYIHDILFVDYPQYYGPSERLYFKPLKFFTKKAMHVITISNSEKSRLVEHGFASREKISVVYHGVGNKFAAIENFSPALIAGVKSKYTLPERYLLYVGRLNVRKNITALVESLKYVEDNQIKLLIVGAESHRNVQLARMITVNKLQDRIVFTGHVPDNELPVIYALSTVFCFPSYAEGFGLPPLEAMKSGVPVIVSDTTSLPEICGSAAVYIKPDNSRLVAEKINKLLMDKDYYDLKVKDGLKHVASFSWNAASRQIAAIVSSLV